MPKTETTQGRGRDAPGPGAAPTRRAMLVGTSAALVAAGAALVPVAAAALHEPADNPDDALLAACAEFEAIERRIIAVYEGPHAIDDDAAADSQAEPLRARLVELLDAMDGMPAQSEAGLRARIRLLSVHNYEGAYSFDDLSGISGRLLQQVMRDGGAGFSVATVHKNPDAELIALAAEAVRLEADYRRVMWATDDAEKNYHTPAGDRARAEFASVSKRQDEVFWLLANTTPATVAGLSAKARAVVAYYGNDAPNNDGLAAPAMWSVIAHLAEPGGAA